jgi:hypothetical protein
MENAIALTASCSQRRVIGALRACSRGAPPAGRLSKPAGTSMSSSVANEAQVSKRSMPAGRCHAPRQVALNIQGIAYG